MGRATVGETGPAMTSQSLNAAWKSSAIMRRSFWALQVVGVVVAVREHVGADHDAALDLGPEALRAGLAVHVVQVAVLGCAVAELDAVEAAQVGRGLGRRDDVVHRDGQLGARQADVNQRGAELFELLERSARGLEHACAHAFTEKFLGHANAQNPAKACRPLRQARGALSAATKSGTGCWALVASRSSKPLMA